MLAIGIDIGGTSIKGGAVDLNGKVYEKFSLPIDKNKNQDEIMENLIQVVKQYIKENDLGNKICGIGLGVPGSIDSTKGICTYSNNLKWSNLHIVDRFKLDFDFPIKITNDANAAALGESIFGAGRKYKNVVMITLGTGVGSGIIIDGKIYDGLEGKGAEIGHSTLVYRGLKCSCGRRGCLEMYASATALARQATKAMKSNKLSLLWKEAEKEGKVNGKAVFNAANKGDETAKKVVDQYLEYLGEGLLNICNIFRPDCIVLSGGIANQKDVITSRLQEYCKENEYGYPLSPETKILSAEIGYDAGLIGAACLVMER